MAKASKEVNTKYVLELNQDEAELVIMLVGAVARNDNSDVVANASDAIWKALDTIVRGDRIEYLIDGVSYHIAQDDNIVIEVV